MIGQSRLSVVCFEGEWFREQLYEPSILCKASSRVVVVGWFNENDAIGIEAAAAEVGDAVVVVLLQGDGMSQIAE